MKKICFLSSLIFALLLPQAWSAEPEALVVQGPAGTNQLTYQQVEDGKLLVSVTDAQDSPMMGLTAKDFIIRQGVRSAKITGVEPLATNKDVGLNIVMVVDNSASMRERKAIEPLLEALEALYQIIRPIDNLALVVFDDGTSWRWTGNSCMHKFYSPRMSVSCAHRSKSV